MSWLGNWLQFLGFLCQYVSSSQVQSPLFKVTFFVADFNPCENLRKHSQQFLLKFVIKFASRFRESIKEGVKYRLSQCVKILLKKQVILFFVADWQEETDIVFRDSFLKLVFWVRILSRVKKLTNWVPKTIRNKCSVLFKVEVLGPLFYRILVAVLPVLFVLYLLEIRSTQWIYDIGYNSAELDSRRQRRVCLVDGKLCGWDRVFHHVDLKLLFHR